MITLEICYDNAKIWSLDGKWHRANGPALTDIDGYEAWYNHGNRHRTDGPAIVFSNNLVQYWIRDKQLTEYELMFIEPTV